MKLERPEQVAGAVHVADDLALLADQAAQLLLRMAACCAARSSDHVLALHDLEVLERHRAATGCRRTSKPSTPRSLPTHRAPIGCQHRHAHRGVGAGQPLGAGDDVGPVVVLDRPEPLAEPAEPADHLIGGVQQQRARAPRPDGRRHVARHGRREPQASPPARRWSARPSPRRSAHGEAPRPPAGRAAALSRARAAAHRQQAAQASSTAACWTLSPSASARRPPGPREDRGQCPARPRARSATAAPSGRRHCGGRVQRRRAAGSRRRTASAVGLRRTRRRQRRLVDLDLAATSRAGKLGARAAHRRPPHDPDARRARVTTSPVQTPQQARAPNGSSRVRATSSTTARSARCGSSASAHSPTPPAGRCRQLGAAPRNCTAGGGSRQQAPQHHRSVGIQGSWSAGSAGHDDVRASCRRRRGPHQLLLG